MPPPPCWLFLPIDAARHARVTAAMRLQRLVSKPCHGRSGPSLLITAPLPLSWHHECRSIWSWISSFFSWLRSKQNQICVVFPIESVPPAQRFCLFGGVPTCFAYNLLSCCLLYSGLGGVQPSTDLQHVGDLGNVEFDLLQLTEGGNSDKRRSFRSEEDSSKILVWCKVQLRFMLWCGMRR